MMIRAGALLPMLPADVDTLSGYGRDHPSLVHLAEREDTLHILAFPRGDTARRFSRHGRLTSVETTGRWDLRVRGGGASRFHVQASFATLENPFVPCKVRWRGRMLSESEWTWNDHDAVFRTTVQGRNGRLSVRSCD